MKSFLMWSTFLIAWNYQARAQREIVLSEAATIDRNNVTITSWHAEKNTFIFYTDNPEYDDNITWYNMNNHTTFSFPRKTTGYEEDGCYFEQYEVSAWNRAKEVSETVYIKWYPKNNSLTITFPDRVELFKGVPITTNDIDE